MEFREHRLDNGLEIIAECNPRAYSTALGFFVNTGARDETDEVAGVSHFLEHMVFKGTPTRSAADVNRELDEMGSFSNARTGEEHTVYHCTVLPEFQNRAVELFADIMRPSLREDDFEMEKQVIIEEISMYEDQPPFNAHEKCMALYFDQHPMSHSILGTVETVGAMKPQQMRDYFQQRYCPSNITLVATGNVDFDGLVKTANQHCGQWEPFEAERDTPRAEPCSKFQVAQRESAAQEYVIQIADGPSAMDEDRYAAWLMATILGDSSGSRFYWDLVYPGRAEYAEIGVYEFQGTGIFMTFLCCAADDAADLLQRIREMEQDLEAHGVTAEELSQAKNKIAGHIVLRAERPGNRLFAVGTNWLHRREYKTVRDSLSAYQAVTIEEVAAVADKYHLSTNTTFAVGPLKTLSLA